MGGIKGNALLYKQVAGIILMECSGMDELLDKQDSGKSVL
jgi:hypothetical protein